MTPFVPFFSFSFNISKEFVSIKIRKTDFQRKSRKIYMNTTKKITVRNRKSHIPSTSLSFSN